jgi:2-polyprenyl-3-methyl-5-hydroxy-6-metoxy-1,4-benzoquinol methylase
MALEVIEHVAEPNLFLKECIELVKVGETGLIG